MPIQWLYIALAYVGLVAGAILFVLPIPLGAPLLIISFAVLLRHSPKFKRWFLQLYRQTPRLRDLLRRFRRRKARAAPSKT